MPTGEETSPSSTQVEVISDLLHQITWGIRLDQLGTWSKALRGMAQLDLHILKLIAERPDIILKEICSELHIPNSTLTSAINRLEERGLLNRVISHRDRRSYGLALTTKGWEIKAEHDRVDQMIATKVIQALEGDEEVTTLTTLLNKIVQRFE
ncbi:MAG: MarR family transcriptional regulator [Chloroflexi bacterium]|nr:MarR family transcriptional regulator [Chloroflexota bacterium]